MICSRREFYISKGFFFSFCPQLQSWSNITMMMQEQHQHGDISYTYVNLCACTVVWQQQQKQNKNRKLNQKSSHVNTSYWPSERMLSQSTSPLAIWRQFPSFAYRQWQNEVGVQYLCVALVSFLHYESIFVYKLVKWIQRLYRNVFISQMDHS